MATVTISQFRKDLFRLVESAANGDLVEFTYKGVLIQLIRPDAPAVDKLSRITPLASPVLVGSPAELDKASREMSEGILKEWETSWDK